MSKKLIRDQIDHWLDQLMLARSLEDIQLCINMLDWLREKEEALR